MSEIQWQEPPVLTRGRGAGERWVPIAAALRERPGAWALIHKGDASFAHHIKTARSKSFAPAGSFEATARSNEDGTCDIYARFVGEGGAS